MPTSFDHLKEPHTYSELKKATEQDLKTHLTDLFFRGCLKVWIGAGIVVSHPDGRYSYTEKGCQLMESMKQAGFKTPGMARSAGRSA